MLQKKEEDRADINEINEDLKDISFHNNSKWLF